MRYLSRRAISFVFGLGALSMGVHNRLRYSMVKRIVAGLILSGGLLGQGAAPALAAGATFYVGTCRSGAFPDIQSAVDSAELLPAAVHKKIIICPGAYNVTTPIAVTATNLTIQGKKGAIVSKTSSSGELFAVTNSDRFTLQKLTLLLGVNWSGTLVHTINSTHVRIQSVTIDGQGKLGSGSSQAIYLNTSTGSILKNKVLRWHTPDYSLSGGIAILALGPETEPMRVSGNTVTDFQGFAIDVVSFATVIVTGNKLTGTTVTTNPAATIGIRVSLVDGGRVTGNQITGGAFPAGTFSEGIELESVNNLRVSANRLSHWNTGIWLSSGCAPLTSTNNRITGNRVTETGIGIEIDSNGTVCDTHVDGNFITGNRIVDTVALGQVGIQVTTASGGGFIGTALDEVVKGNKITHFTTGMTSPLPDPANNITGIFGPNKILP